jgi:hypothetical protein
LESLESLDWLPPKRKETKTAVEIQKGDLVTPWELSIGWTKFALKGEKGHRITLTKETIANRDPRPPRRRQLAATTPFAVPGPECDTAGPIARAMQASHRASDDSQSMLSDSL